MKELLISYLPEILSVLVGIAVAVGGVVVSVLQYKKSKVDNLKKLEEERTARLEIEAKKIELEKMMLDGAFIICPNCETKIKAKDMVFYTKEVEKNV